MKAIKKGYCIRLTNKDDETKKADAADISKKIKSARAKILSIDNAIKNYETEKEETANTAVKAYIEKKVRELVKSKNDIEEQIVRMNTTLAKIKDTIRYLGPTDGDIYVSEKQAMKQFEIAKKIYGEKYYVELVNAKVSVGDDAVC